MSFDEQQSIEWTATDFRQWLITAKQDIDLSTLSWQLSFNPTSVQTETPVAASVVAGTVTRSTAKSTVQIETLIGPGGTLLDPGVWHVFAHTASGLTSPVIYLGVLFVNGTPNAAADPSVDAALRAYTRSFAFPRNPREVLLSDFIQPGDNGDAALAWNRAIATLPFGTKYSSGWKNTRIIGGAGVLVIDQDIVIKSPAYIRHNIGVRCVTQQTLVDLQGSTAGVFRDMSLDASVNSYDMSGVAFVNGVYYSSTGDAPSAFYLLRVVDSYFENVTVKGFASHGIQADQCQWVTFNGVKSWHNGGYGFSLGYSADDAMRGNDNTFLGCEAAENNLGGAYWVGQRHSWLGGDIQFNRRVVQTNAAIDGPSATVTFAAAHGLAIGDQLSIESLVGTIAGAALAGPMYVRAVPTSTTITLSETIGGALAAALTGSGTAQVTKYAPGLTIDTADSISPAVSAHFEGNSTHVLVRATNPATQTGQPRGVTLLAPIFVISRHVRKFVENQGINTTIIGGGTQNDPASLYGYKDQTGNLKKAPFQMWSTGSATILGFPGLTGETNLVCDELGNVASATGWAGGGLYSQGGRLVMGARTDTLYGTLTNGAQTPLISINGSNRVLINATNQATNLQANNLRFFDANTGASQIARIGQLSGAAVLADVIAAFNALEAHVHNLGLTL